MERFVFEKKQSQKSDSGNSESRGRLRAKCTKCDNEQEIQEEDLIKIKKQISTRSVLSQNWTPRENMRFQAKGSIVAYKKNGSLAFYNLESENEPEDDVHGPRKCMDSVQLSNPGDVACLSGKNLSFVKTQSRGSRNSRQRSASVCCGEQLSRKQSDDVIWTLTFGGGKEENAKSSPNDLKKYKMMRGDYSAEDIKTVGEVPEEERTTVMVRNIPNRYNKEAILGLLHEYNYAEIVDFLYMPIDFRSTSNMGYCFINFTNPSDARDFKLMFQGFCNWRYNSDKKCDIQWSAPYQGLAAHIDRYRSSPVMHKDVKNQYKPILLMNGEEVPFPPPLKTIPPPTIRPTKQTTKRRKEKGKKTTTQERQELFNL